MNSRLRDEDGALHEDGRHFSDGARRGARKKKKKNRKTKNKSPLDVHNCAHNITNICWRMRAYTAYGLAQDPPVLS